MKLLGVMVATVVLCLGLAAQQTTTNDKSAGQSMKDAGHETSRAAKDVGHGTVTGAKKVGHETKKTTKKVVHSGAHKTDQGATAVEKKTEPHD